MSLATRGRGNEGTQSRNNVEKKQREAEATTTRSNEAAKRGNEERRKEDSELEVEAKIEAKTLQKAPPRRSGGAKRS